MKKKPSLENVDKLKRKNCKSSLVEFQCETLQPLFHLYDKNICDFIGLMRTKKKKRTEGIRR